MSGRDDELAALTSLWEEATAGTSKSLLLTGEPGVGKAGYHLCDEMAASATPTELRRPGTHGQPAPARCGFQRLLAACALCRTQHPANPPPW